MRKLIGGMLLLCVFFASCSKEEFNEQDEEQFYYYELEENHSDFAKDLLSAVNAYRLDLGLNDLSMGSIIANSLAVEHCLAMRDAGKISHDGFSRRTQILKNEGAESVGENVAFGYKEAADIVTAWSNSPSHKRILEGRFTHGSIGVVPDSRGRLYVTQLFYR